MRWQRKAFLQQAFSRMPGGEWLYYLMQRHVTRSLPPSEKKTREIIEIEAQHVDAWQQYGNRPLADAVFYQFGAGWTMAGPLTFFGLGVNHQILFDIRRLIRPWLINCTIETLQRPPCAERLNRRIEHFVPSQSLATLAVLRHRYGIDYHAPADARATGLPDASVDCITSTNTLEHIPRADIAAILAECRRILRPGGVMSFQVDYQDHYSYFDRSISVYNFLQFSDSDWDRFNPSLHYQNRMRHPDYVALYREAGFEPLLDQPRPGSAADEDFLQTLPLHDRYRGFTTSELAIRTSYIVLRKSAAASEQGPAAAPRAA